MDWRVNPLKDQFKDAAAGTSALGFMMLSLSSFLPAQIAAACMLFGAMRAWNQIRPLVVTRHIPVKNEHGTLPSPELQITGAQIAKRLNMKIAPVINEVPNLVALRSVVSDKNIMDMTDDQIRRVIDNYAVALMHKNRIEYSHAYKERMLKRNPNTMRFTIAHETAHIAADDLVRPSQCASFVNQFSTIPALTVYMSGVLLCAMTDKPNVIFSGEPNNVFMMLTQLIGGLSLSILSLRYSSRLAEFRADRNALYATQDPEAAKDALRTISNAYTPDKSLWGRIRTSYKHLKSTHPSNEARIEAIDRAWAEMNKAPKP